MESARAAEFFCGPALETTTIDFGILTLSMAFGADNTTTKAFLAKKRGS
jgi:hypothetical protein